ncbi:hypothetical protein J4760_04210 [Salinicoccus sp. ID82-1]|uniref:hypothetical protein n=1 Tax=Salinicoccus sp. ID82-1 TaxID=2820269 RepID=UPI001F28C859|nr:hypothetical protein [Salinicoccus sp. ID82-1]MCG1009256.1 hypothetical protein [Salinicoccus sp. ID82-1]
MKWIGVFLFGIICSLSVLQIISTEQILMLSFILIVVLTIVSPVIAEWIAKKRRTS